MASRLLTVGYILGALLQPGLSASMDTSVTLDEHGSIVEQKRVAVRKGGVVGDPQAGAELPGLLEQSLIRRMGVDTSGHVYEIGGHGQAHAPSAHHAQEVHAHHVRQSRAQPPLSGAAGGSGSHLGRGQPAEFTCAQVRAKYGAEAAAHHTTEATLCADVAKANGSASCCGDNPPTCCKDPDRCTLDDAYSALDMEMLCKPNALIHTMQGENSSAQGDSKVSVTLEQLGGATEADNEVLNEEKALAAADATLDEQAGNGVGSLGGRWEDDEHRSLVIRGGSILWDNGGREKIRAEGGGSFSAVTEEGETFKARRVNSNRLEWDDGDVWRRLPDEGHAVANDGTADAIAEVGVAGTQLEEADEGAREEVKTLDWKSKPRQMERKLMAFRDEYLEKPNSRVRDSLLNNATIADALEELRGSAFFRKSVSGTAEEFHMFLKEQGLTSARKIPLWSPKSTVSFSSKYEGLKAEDFQNKVAGGAAGALFSILNGQPPDWAALGTLGLQLVGLIHPALSLFAGFFMGFLGGNPNDALVKFILKEVDKRIRQNNARVISNTIKDLLEELEWMPGLVEKAGTDVSLSYWLIIQHDLATKKNNVWHESCIAKAPWNSITRPTLMEENSSIPSPDLVGTHDASGDNPLVPALVEENSDHVSIIRSHDNDELLDNALEKKGSPRRRRTDPCDLWNSDEKTVQMQWYYAENQLMILEMIAMQKASFIDDVAARINKIAHEYAGMTKQAFTELIPRRLEKIHRINTCSGRGRRGRCVRRTESVRDDQLGQTFNNRNFRNYYNSINSQLQARRDARIEKLMCFSRAAARQNVGTCGAR